MAQKPKLLAFRDIEETLTSQILTEALGPFGTHKYLAIDLRSLTPKDLPSWAALSPRLVHAPCPMIGLTSDVEEHSAQFQVFDVLVETAEDLARIAANIDQTPIAAMTLVQTLRATETLQIQDALAVESMAYASLQKGQEFLRWLDEQDSVLRGATSNETHDAGPSALTSRQDGTLRVVLNRPEQRNAINTEMRDGLVEAFDLAAMDPTITQVSISGNGKCFSIGGDLSEFGSVNDPATAHAIRSVRLPARALVPCRERAYFHLHGACIGAGIELPAFGARVTAVANTFVQLPELQFGLIPGAGGCVSLPRRIGRQRTAYLALTGKRVRARETLEWGLIDEVVG